MFIESQLNLLTVRILIFQFQLQLPHKDFFFSLSFSILVYLLSVIFNHYESIDMNRIDYSSTTTTSSSFRYVLFSSFFFKLST